MKSIAFYQLSIDKLRRFCQTLPNAIEKKRGNEVIIELERELQSTRDHERMIGEIHQNLLTLYTKGGGRPAGGDLNDVDRFYNAVVDERPTRDPDVFGPNPSHAAPP
jgi:hypothetical protein